MAISSDYAMPVSVNGYVCRNCTDVAYAQRHIDPEHPKSGPFGVNAESDPTRQLERAVSASAQPQGAESSAPVTPAKEASESRLDPRARSGAVVFGGELDGLAPPSTPPAAPTSTTLGTLLDVRA